MIDFSGGKSRSISSLTLAPWLRQYSEVPKVISYCFPKDWLIDYTDLRAVSSLSGHPRHSGAVTYLTETKLKEHLLT